MLLDRLVEVSGPGPAAQEYFPLQFPFSGFDATDVDPDHIQFNGTLLNVSTIVLYSFFQTSGYISNRTVPSETLKSTFSLGNWPFEVSTNILRLEFLLREQNNSYLSVFSEEVFSLSSASFDAASSTYTYELSSPSLLVRMSLIGEAVADGVAVAIPPPLLATSSVTLQAAQIGDPVVRVLVFLPHYRSSLIYDPEFGVVLSPQNPGSGNDVPIGLIIGLSVGIPTFMCVIVAAFIAVAAVITAIKFRHRKGAISFGGESQQETL